MLSISRALLRLVFDLGLRRGELASLNLEHLDLLRAWLEQRGLEPGPLFINFDRVQKGRRLTWAVRKIGTKTSAKAWRRVTEGTDSPFSGACRSNSSPTSK
ncbi:hypothetical protein [Candidatus Nephthysia bennettiae]|uniref:Uncharacterized protein n=1 Tax=Candidatus Nephthysia bennettiae TaxID=3127016 RepID=A0A934K1N3_9BACT|nr:hypothetical protein [Candidatus Dormibacteraeota bacterium]